MIKHKRRFNQSGYYADPDTECQAFHVCTADGQGGLSKNSFLCPNGTIFNQNYFICDWWFNFDCSEASGESLSIKFLLITQIVTTVVEKLNCNVFP
jgi:hypothetical protein